MGSFTVEEMPDDSVVLDISGSQMFDEFIYMDTPESPEEENNPITNDPDVEVMEDDVHPETNDPPEAEENTSTDPIVNVFARIRSRPLLLQRGRFNVSTMTAHLDFVFAPRFEPTRVDEEPLAIMGVTNANENELPPTEEMEIDISGLSVGTEPEATCFCTSRSSEFKNSPQTS